MAISRVSGSMLSSKLDRQGTDLQFTTNSRPLFYMDFSQYLTGVNTNVATQTITVNGNLSTSHVLVDGLSIGSKNSTDTLVVASPINLGTINNVKITDSIANSIIYTDAAGNLSFGTLASLVGQSGFAANSMALGFNTTGRLATPAATLTSTTTVVDAVALLNQAVGNVTDGTVIFPTALPTASSATAGIVKAGTELAVDAFGTLNVDLTAVHQTVAPVNDAAYSLGTSDRRWNGLAITGNIVFGDGTTMSTAPATVADSIHSYVFTESTRWLVVHNRNTKRFLEVLTDADGSRFFAGINIINTNSFEVILTTATAGTVDVTFI